MLHVLIAPDKAEFAKRIRSRGQEAQMASHFAFYDWRMQNRASYDLALTGNESPTRILELIHSSIS